MSLMNIFDISGSALTAQTMRLDAVSANMANAKVVSSSPDAAYRARLPVFATLFADNEVTGVEVDRVVESRTPVQERYELANMIAASKSYTSNVEVMITSRDLLQRTLALGS